MLDRLRVIPSVAVLANRLMLAATSDGQETAVREVLDERMPALLEVLEGVGKKQRPGTARMLYAVGSLSIVDARWRAAQAVPPHSHAWTAVASRDGECRFTFTDGTATVLRAGEWLFLPTSTEHALEIPTKQGGRTVHVCGWKIPRSIRGMERAP